MLVISAAGAVMAKEASDKQADAVEKSAKASYEAQMDQLQEQRHQINQQASDQMSAAAKQEQAKMAQLRVAAGESGVSGISVDRSERGLEQELSQDIASIDGNRRNAVKQTTAQAAGIRAQTMGQVNSVRRIGWGETGLSIAGAAVQSFGMSQSSKPTTKGATA